MKYIKAIISAAILVFIDQFTKYLAVIWLKGSPQGKILIPGVFRLLYLENNGSAFGLMQGRRTFFIIFTIAVLIALAIVYAKLPETRRMGHLRRILVVIFAGAVGNFIDRLLHGYVVDFFYFELIDFPIFNVADIYVTVSAILMVLLILFYYKDADFKQDARQNAA